MNAGMMFLVIVGGLTGFVTTAYLAISVPGVILWKIYRKLRYGYKLYD